MIIDPQQQSVKENHKLMIGSIVPRPIAFVSTQSQQGNPNLAPFSFFNGVCSNPPTIMFAPARRAYDGKIKDTLRNIRDTDEFVVNIVSNDMVEPMVTTSTDFDPEVNEFEISGLTPVPSNRVKPPRVDEARVSFECVLNQIIEIGKGGPGSGFAVFGTIVLFHVVDEVYSNGRIDLNRLEPVGRLAGNNFCHITDTFTVVRKIRPDQ